MDQPVTTASSNTSSLALSLKKRVEKEVLETIIDGLQDGKLDSQKAQDIAKDTLATLAKLDEHEETIENFYKNLADKYPIFNLLYTKIKGDLARSREITAHRQALAAIDQGKIEEAHQIVKGAIDQTAHEATDAR